MNQYIAYIEETLHVAINAYLYTQLDTLPLYLQKNYEYYALTIYNVECLFILPKELTNLTLLRKHSVLLKNLTGMNCVLCLENIRVYTREKMLEEGIPFVALGHQIYMPFLGIVLSNKNAREVKRPEQISFITQKLILTAIYKGWTRKTLNEAAAELGVSKMTISRSFDELLAFDLPLVKTEGKMRFFLWNGSKRMLWEKALPILRSPIRHQYMCGEQFNIENAKLGGISALSHFSMLSENSYEVFAITKDIIKSFELNKLPLSPKDEDPLMVVQVIAHDLGYGNSSIVDPLTAILSLTNEEKADPRVEIAIEKVLEDCLNG